MLHFVNRTAIQVLSTKSQNKHAACMHITWRHVHRQAGANCTDSKLYFWTIFQKKIIQMGMGPHPLPIFLWNFFNFAKPLRPLGNFGNFLYPTLPVSFGRDSKSRWPLLSGVYARGSKISHTEGKCVTCRGLHILPGQ